MDTYIMHCSIQKDYKVPYNLSEFPNSSIVENFSNEPKSMGVGAVSGILIALVIDVLFSLEYNKSCGLLTRALSKTFNAATVSRTLVLTILIFTAPIVTLVLLLALVYKVLCSVIIRRKDKHFVAFLDSFDVFWSLEDDSSKSIINVLGIIESDSPNAIASDIKQKLLSIFPSEKTRKIFFRRYEEYGFYYWRRYSVIDIEQYVEIVEFPKPSLGVEDLENFMTDLQDQPLPYKDEGLFKIIISRQRVGSSHTAKGDYGIIFRIHHSVGDGVALIEFLCQTFGDKSKDSPISMFSIPEQSNHESPGNLISMMQKLIEIPLCFVNGILRKPDKNVLHGPALIGKKVFKWTEPDEALLKKVKDIKENVEGLNFSDVLITALSKGLRDVLAEKENIPVDVAVILPVRFPKDKTSHTYPILKNDFSVTILDVPVEDSDNLKEINRRCNLLRKSADPLTNYYFLKLVCSVLPKRILQPLLASNQATMVFSNMPGPAAISLCGGNVLKSLVFFVPHKGSTEIVTSRVYRNLRSFLKMLTKSPGLGVTALCYGGVLRFAAMADSALVSKPEDLAVILTGMEDEIRRLHARYVQ